MADIQQILIYVLKYFYNPEKYFIVQCEKIMEIIIMKHTGFQILGLTNQNI